MRHLRRGSCSWACSALLVALAALALLTTPAHAATDDQNLTGLAYLADGTPLSATPWANNTSFAVYVNHAGSWSTAWRYPVAPTWYLTSGGAYSIVLPAAQQNLTWASGDPYRVEFDVSAIAGVPGRTDNATSHGTGDPGKFSPYGATDNAIAWNATDNWQRWDVVLLALPDLAVNPAEIVHTPPGPVVSGTAVTINATVRNLGAVDTANVAVRFTDGAPPAGTRIGVDRTLALVPAGGLAYAQTTWIAAPPGSHTLCADADPDNVIAETNETNNVGCVPLAVVPPAEMRPDYVPSQPQPASPVRTGLSSPLSFSVQVLNQGNATGAAVSTLAFYNASTPATPLATFPVPPMAPSETSARFAAPWTSPATAGTVQVVADVDHRNDLLEWNETNNRYAWTVDVLAGPVTNLVVGQPNVTAAQTYVTSATPLSFSVLDQSGAGIRNTTYRVDGGAWVNYTLGGPFTLAADGAHVVEWFSTDFAGNVEPVASATLRVDDTPPTTTLTVGDPRYVAATTFVTSSTPFTLAATDGGVTPVGLASTEYRIDGGAWTSYTGAFTLAGEGPHAVAYRATDRLGNAELARTFNATVDDTPPVTTIAPATGPYTPATAFTLTATDSGSGANRTEYRIDGGPWIRYTSAFTVAAGNHIIGYRSADRLNNTEAERALPVTVGTPPPLPQPATNWKPLVAAVFALVLALVGAWSARRAPWPAGSRRRLRAFLLASLPFVAAEAATGVVSLFTGLLAAPPGLGAGTVVDLAILVAGLLIAVLRSRGPTPTNAAQAPAAR